MVNVYVVIGILFLHWIFDFILQSDEQAKEKSKSWGALCEHTFMYSICWTIPMLLYGVYSNNNGMIMLFMPITFITHTAIDYYTSRIGKMLWEENRVHDFFVNIGFDQWLHQAQLLLTFYLLTK